MINNKKDLEQLGFLHYTWSVFLPFLPAGFPGSTVVPRE